MTTHIGCSFLILSAHSFSPRRGRILRRTSLRFSRDCGVSSKGEAMAESRTPVRNNDYLRTADVARVLHVSTKTVSRWANDKKLPYMRTLGGHRRYPAQAIQQLAEGLIGRS